MSIAYPFCGVLFVSIKSHFPHGVVVKRFQIPPLFSSTAVAATTTTLHLTATTPSTTTNFRLSVLITYLTSAKEGGVRPDEISCECGPNEMLNIDKLQASVSRYISLDGNREQITTSLQQ